MARLNVPNVPFPQGPFSNGINRVIDRTALRGGLFDAQGVFRQEIGRWRACYEGTTTEATFEALTDATADISKSPQRLMYWREVGKLIAASNFRVAYNGGSVVFVESATGDSAKDISFCEYLGYLIICVDGEPMRFINPDNYTDATDYSDVDSLQTGESLSGWLNATGFPGYIYHTYITVSGTADTTGPIDKSLFIAGANINNAYTGSGQVGIHGAPVALPGASTAQYYAAALVVAKDTDANNWAMGRVRGGSYFIQNNENSATTVATKAGIDLAEELEQRFKVRFGLPSQQFMGRFPTPYRRRLCVAEGRNYEYSKLNGGANGAYMRWSTGGLGADILRTVDNGGAGNDTSVGDLIRVGDEIILYERKDGLSSYESRIKDYVLSTHNATKVTVTEVNDVNPVTNCEFIHTPAHGLLTSTQTGFWVRRRALTNEQRRTVWFAGRAADSANSVSADITDFMKFESASNVVVGTDSDGDITALFAQADDRLIVGMTSAIYAILGDPPLGTNVPTNFTVRPPKIASVGVQNNDCIVTDSGGQAVYFATPQAQIHRLYGNTISNPSLSTPVEPHPFWPAAFKQLAFVDNKLYCLEDADDPLIWICDLTNPNGPQWSYTWRGNSGQDQTGTLAALEISDSGYGGALTVTGSSVTINSKSITLGSSQTWRKRAPVTITADDGTVYRTWATNAGSSSTALTVYDAYPGATDTSVTVTIYPGNRLYPASADHGGIFVPYAGVDGEVDKLFGVFTDGTDYKIRSINAKADEHNYANLHHAVRLQGNYETAGLRTVNKNIRTITAISTKPMLDKSAGATYSQMRIDVTNSEGATILSRNLTPVDSNVDSTYYEFHGSGGLGDAAVSPGFGDGISSLPGELAEADVLFRDKGRQR